MYRLFSSTPHWTPLNPLGTQVGGAAHLYSWGLICGLSLFMTSTTLVLCTHYLGVLTYSALLGTEYMLFGAVILSATHSWEEISSPCLHGGTTLHPPLMLCFVRKKTSFELLVRTHRELGIQSSGLSSHSVLSSWVTWVCPCSTLSGSDAIEK